MKKYLFTIILFAFVCNGVIKAYESNELYQMYEQLNEPVLDFEKTYDVQSDTIFHHDITIVLDTGKIAFFKPIQIENDSIIFGAYFEGKGSVLFFPSVQMEQNQLNRFFHSDSLNRGFDKTVLFFAPDIYESLISGLVVSKKPFKKKYVKKAKKLHEKILEDTDFLYSFELLRNLTSPFGKPYLISCMQTDHDDELIYMFNSYLREEVRLWKRYKVIGDSFMEQVSSYSQYNIDESYTNINGRNKEQIDVIHYDISSTIDRKGILTSEAKVKANVLSGPFQLLEFSILPSIEIDSVIDNAGRQVMFKREKIDVTFRDWESNEIALFLNQEYFYGDSMTLTFYYQGEVADKEVGEYYVFAGANWYPRYGYGDRATFDLTFKTDKQYTFTSCGYLQDKMTVGDLSITKWSVRPEAKNISFNIGNLKKYTFKENDVVPVEIYFSKDIHNSIAGGLSESLIAIGKDMEKQVAEDVMNSMRVFGHYFGNFPLPKITVSEILTNHGEAFPGFVHLGFNTWINTDKWGNDRIFRAHEVAHQWWGVGVGYETYHDQWLSEGLSDYSALLYYQAVSDNKKFLNKLKESRNDIFSARNFLFSSGEESGPIALGYRTSSTETEGDYGLIIYNKGAYVLHMLRNIMIDLKTMNEDNFFKMLKEFYETYRGKDASTQDFKRIAEKYVGIKLDWFFDQWVYNNYLPEYKFNYDIVHNDSTNLLDAKCTIITKGVPEGFKMYIPLEIQFDKKTKAYIRLLVDSNNYTFDLPGLSRRPKKLILNPFESVLAKIKQ